MKPLTDEQVKKLESIEIKWDVLDSNWNEMFGFARKYYNEHGNLYVTQRYVALNGKNLGIWVSNQRRLYKKNKLSDNYIAMLESIGMIWDTKKNKPDI